MKTNHQSAKKIENHSQKLSWNDAKGRRLARKKALNASAYTQTRVEPLDAEFNATNHF